VNPWVKLVLRICTLAKRFFWPVSILERDDPRRSLSFTVFLQPTDNFCGHQRTDVEGEENQQETG
jgi:hypothetical protein